MIEPRLLAFMGTCQSRVEAALERCLPGPRIHPAPLHQAMRYASLEGGKRVRPLLVYAAGQAAGVAIERLDTPACAVELIHAYSLVHDDLPAMDNDLLRRGKPTCHVAFGEAAAILAGDALQALAFHILAHDHDSGIAPAARLAMVEQLALAAGSRGMVGGQAIDLAAVGNTLSIAELEDMHIHKTGALIRASVLLGAMASPELAAERLAALDGYAKCIGLAFQVVDDILDVEGSTEVLGKTAQADQALDKPTYPALLGLEGARQRARELHEAALASLADCGAEADPLRWLSAYIVERSH
jgi:farnesyl diphosphate synthase